MLGVGGVLCERRECDGECGGERGEYCECRVPMLLVEGCVCCCIALGMCDGIMFFFTSGKIVFVNELFVWLYGYRVEEIIVLGFDKLDVGFKLDIYIEWL